MRSRPDPIFREVRVRSIGVDLDVDDPASNQQDSNLATATPLAQLDWPRREGFSCKRIEEHKQEDVNTQYDIANMNEAKQRGVRELDLKGLIDTVKEIKNGGPGSL